MRPSLHFAKKILGKNSNVIGIEIGVASADNAFVILCEWSEMKLYGVEINPSYKEIIDTRMRPFENYTLIIGDSSEVAKQFPDEFFDFVYIDDDHDYDGPRKSMEAWYPKVKSGGIFAGHDYYPTGDNEYDVWVEVNRFFRKNNLVLTCDELDWWTVKPRK